MVQSVVHVHASLEPEPEPEGVDVMSWHGMSCQRLIPPTLAAGIDYLVEGNLMLLPTYLPTYGIDNTSPDRDPSSVCSVSSTVQPNPKTRNY